MIGWLRLAILLILIVLLPLSFSGCGKRAAGLDDSEVLFVAKLQPYVEAPADKIFIDLVLTAKSASPEPFVIEKVELYWDEAATPFAVLDVKKQIPLLSSDITLAGIRSHLSPQQNSTISPCEFAALVPDEIMLITKQLSLADMSPDIKPDSSIEVTARAHIRQGDSSGIIESKAQSYYGSPLFGDDDDEQGAGDTGQPSDSVSPGETYTVKGVVGAFPEPVPYSDAEPLFFIKPGEQVTVSRVSGEFAGVISKSREGFIPSWYLTDFGGEIRLAPSREMIVAHPTTFSLYPNQENRQGFLLEQGRVVHVIKEYGEWYSVGVITSDPYLAGEKWIRKESLVAFDPGLSREGSVRQDAVVYDSQGREISDFAGGWHVEITGERGEMYEVVGAGGEVGFIRKSDFVPNPWETFRKARFSYIVDKFREAEQIELRDIANQPVGAIKGDEILEFAGMVSRMTPGSAPSGYTGGEPVGKLILSYPNETIELMLAQGGYLRVMGDFSEKFLGKWYENEQYLIFGEDQNAGMIVQLFR